MGLLFMDGFDHYATASILDKWSMMEYYNNGSVVIDATSGRRGSGCFRIGSGGSGYGVCFIGKTLVPADNTAIVGVAFKPVWYPGAHRNVIAIRQGASNTTQVSLRLNQDLTLTVTRGTHTGTVLGTTTFALTLGVFQYIEWRTVIGGGTSGSTDVWINGVNRLPLTGINTLNAATATWSVVRLGSDESNSFNWVGTDFNYFDDLYVLDGSGGAPFNGPLGDCRVSLHLPSGASASPSTNTQWTVTGAGTNNTAVDDATPNDDADYVTSTAVDQIDTFPVPDAPVVGATIYGVQVNFSLKKMSEGMALVAPVVRHGGVNRVGSNIPPTSATDYTYMTQVLPVIPVTGEAWTEANFNAAEFGYKKTV